MIYVELYRIFIKDWKWNNIHKCRFDTRISITTCHFYTNIRNILNISFVMTLFHTFLKMENDVFICFIIQIFDQYLQLSNVIVTQKWATMIKWTNKNKQLYKYGIDNNNNGSISDIESYICIYTYFRDDSISYIS